MIVKLRNARAEAIAQMDKLNQTALAENREFSAEEQAKYDALNAEQKQLKNRIAIAEEQATLNARLNISSYTYLFHKIFIHKTGLNPCIILILSTAV